MAEPMQLGVCYYPEHWPESRWAQDAEHMRRIGISVVRIGEFAWSRLEPREGDLQLDWLHRAMDVLHSAGLSIVLGTPTATPPRWLVAKYPDMLAVDALGNPRGFGSRRHYCFSHLPYRRDCARIVTALAERLGQHPGLTAWQTDNEYGCHSTIISYSEAAKTGFQQWCEQRYQTIDQLNERWGNVFWSMEYPDFASIEMPTQAVTETNPAQQLAFWRYSSDQVVEFNRLQCRILRERSPGRDIVHNYMGNFVEFDHYDVSRDLDVATWDNYPLGFLTRDNSSTADRQRYLRTGHPDSSAFHHDLYRGMCNGRWWVMEQQPGPVNWAPYNPSPLPGMVRFWGLEALAHGAEVMSYFRWRQAPFAQEQLHTGLLLATGEEDVAAREVAQLSNDISTLRTQLPTSGNDKSASALDTIALVFDYTSLAALDIQNPGGDAFHPLEFVQSVYSACRRCGVDIDIVPSSASLRDYSAVLIPCLALDDADLVEQLEAYRKTDSGPVVLFTGTACKTSEFSLPDSGAPASFQRLMNIEVVRSESLPPDVRLEAIDTRSNDEPSVLCHLWREQVLSDIQPLARFEDGWGYHYANDGVHYINSIPTDNALNRLISGLFRDYGLKVMDLGPDLRIREHEGCLFAFNFGPSMAKLDHLLAEHLSAKTSLLLGKRVLGPAEVAAWVVED